MWLAKGSPLTNPAIPFRVGHDSSRLLDLILHALGHGSKMHRQWNSSAVIKHGACGSKCHHDISNHQLSVLLRVRSRKSCGPCSCSQSESISNFGDKHLVWQWNFHAIILNSESSEQYCCVWVCESQRLRRTCRILQQQSISLPDLCFFVGCAKSFFGHGCLSPRHQSTISEYELECSCISLQFGNVFSGNALQSLYQSFISSSESI